MTFIDTNVILDLLTDDRIWADWSAEAMMAATGPRRIAPVVYAELAGCFGQGVQLDAELSALRLSVEQPRPEALFRAGQAHAAYRRRGGSRDRVLPDFLIGAQAHDRAARLVTRDAQRYRTSFPDLRLTAP